ncbi:hypothetical protein INR49_031722 [Caranx melampygus]|nr:hypothetical protein INR49_031722 [Caranx melampygus]
MLRAELVQTRRPRASFTGVLGSLKSGKSALVNKYITGSYAALEKPDGGRYKKEVLVDGQSHLLLIREEAGAPDAQFCSWVDAVILVFSLENEASFQELYQLYSQLSAARTDIPVIVVGTQDKISSTNPRVIEDQRARQLCIDVRHSLFYETCATYGFNVERVFSEGEFRLQPRTLQDTTDVTHRGRGLITAAALCLAAAQKIVAQKKQAALQACKSLPNSPSHSGGSTPGSASLPGQPILTLTISSFTPPSPLPLHPDLLTLLSSTSSISTSSSSSSTSTSSSSSQASNGPSCGYAYSLPSTLWSVVVDRLTPRIFLLSPSITSLHRLRSDSPSFCCCEHNRDTDKKAADAKGDVSSARGVPIKQSILWKRSGSSLNKEWKKKYVTLSNNGTLSYHSSSSDYNQNTNGKEIDLLRVTVKVPGKRPPRAVAPAGPAPVAPGSAAGVNGLSKGVTAADGTSTVPQLCPSTLSVVDDRSGGLSPQGGERGLQRCPSSLSTKAQSVDALEATASPFAGKDPGQSSPMSDRKKNRRKKSMNQKGDTAVGQAEEEENADFIIVSFTGQTWHFDAQSQEERDSWVSAIESQILASLQSCESGRNKARRSSQSEAVALQAIRNAKGNGLCVDCEAPNPTWASLNLGALICIECSGIHRNLGTHLSGSAPGPGRLARRAHSGPGCHRKPHGQQHLGELHTGQDQTHTQRNTVGSGSSAHPLDGPQVFDCEEREYGFVLSMSRGPLWPLWSGPWGPAARGQHACVAADCSDGQRPSPAAAALAHSTKEQINAQLAGSTLPPHGAARRLSARGRGHGPSCSSGWVLLRSLLRRPAGRSALRDRCEGEGQPGPHGHDDGQEERQ